MNTARIVVLTIALSAGGVAAYLASGSDNKPPPSEPVAQLQTVDVLVAKADIGLGQSVKPGESAMADLAGRDCKQQLHSPQRTSRRHQRRSPARSRARHSSRASRSGSRSWSRPTDRASWRRSCPPACVPSQPKSRRRPAPAASSCRTTASTSFFPSAKRCRTANGADVVNSEIILPNVRVLAIDQAPKEKDGQNAVVGKTVTLELKPEQAETLARARQTGTLSLALRSITDINVVENTSDDQAPKRGDSIDMVRYGIPSSTTTQK